MERRFIVAAVVAVIAVAAVLLYVSFTRKGEEPPKDVEHVGGKYNVTLSFWEDYAEIEYTDEDGKHSAMYFKAEMRDGLDWIRANTPENATFLCWWDYGHMIKGYAERNTVVRNPSEEILESVADPNSVKEFDPHERIRDVATALATNNSTEMLQVLEKYGVTHIVVCGDDSIKAWWMYKISGLEPTDYLVSQDSSWEFSDAGMQTMIARLLDNRDTGFVLIYEDEEIKIYKVD